MRNSVGPRSPPFGKTAEVPDEVATLLRERCPELLETLLGNITQEAFEYLLSKVNRLVALQPPAFRFYVRAIWASVSQRQGSGQRHLSRGAYAPVIPAARRSDEKHDEGSGARSENETKSQAQGTPKWTGTTEIRSDFVGSPSAGLRASHRTLPPHVDPTGERI